MDGQMDEQMGVWMSGKMGRWAESCDIFIL